MVNVVSSAIVNKPPPLAIANLLARRNKIHHLNPKTDETLLKLFNKDPGESNRTAAHNQVTMPSRNFAMLTENSPNNQPRPGQPEQPEQFQQFQQFRPPQAPQEPRHEPSNQHLRPVTATTNGQSAYSAYSAPSTNGQDITSVNTRTSVRSQRSSKHNTNGHLPISAGEAACGTTHKAAQPAEHGRGNDGGLDICIRVEIDQHDHEGRTESYGLTVPTLTVAAGA